MQLAHTGNDGLAGFFVSAHTERRIFLRELAQRNTHSFLVSLGLWLNGNRNHRLREIHLFKIMLIHDTQRVARRDIFQTDSCRNITGTYFFNFFTLIRVHLHEYVQYALSYRFAGCRPTSRFQYTRVNTEETSMCPQTGQSQS